MNCTKAAFYCLTFNESSGPEKGDMSCCILNGVFCIRDDVCGILCCILYLALKGVLWL